MELRKWLVAACMLSIGSLALASSFGLSPMRVELSAAAPTAIVNVTNSGDAPVTIQISAYTWTQPDGKDAYEETRGFIISPPIVTIAPGARQIVRVALRGTPHSDVEQPYRLMFREVPQSDEATGGTVQFRIAIGMNIPMFVAPLRGAAAAKPIYSFDGAGSDTPRLRIVNEGNGNLRLADLVVTQEGSKLAEVGVMVVLPGATGFVPLPKDQLRPGGAIGVQAQSNGGRVDVSVPAAKP